MAYQNNIPQASDRPSDSQSDLLNNFQALKTYLDRNHVAIDDPAGNVNEGKHRFCQFPEQIAAPGTLANEGAFYTKVGTNPAQTNLFFRGESNGFEYQITKTVSASTATFGATTTGWTFLPGNLLMLYGTMSLSANTKTTITFAGLNLPDFNNADYNIQFTAFKNSDNSNVNLDAWVYSKATGNFVIYNASNTFTGTWLAIGK